jgi:hypothetical protein
MHRVAQLVTHPLGVGVGTDIGQQRGAECFVACYQRCAEYRSHADVRGRRRPAWPAVLAGEVVDAHQGPSFTRGETGALVELVLVFGTASLARAVTNSSAVRTVSVDSSKPDMRAKTAASSSASARSVSMGDPLCAVLCGAIGMPGQFSGKRPTGPGLCVHASGMRGACAARP